MKKVLFMMAMLMVTASAGAKTTYIPSYRSYIHIVNRTDTVKNESKALTLEMAEASGMFTVRFEHEDVTSDKVKSIKQAKAIAGWMTVTSLASGVGSAFTKDNMSFMAMYAGANITSDIAEIQAANAESEQLLQLALCIDNTTDGELMVADLDRGMVWYVQPHETLRLATANPDATRLRISDIRSEQIRYVSAIGGSSLTKYMIGYEDDECWIVPVKDKDEKKGDYKRINKHNFSEAFLTDDQFQQIKAAQEGKK